MSTALVLLRRLAARVGSPGQAVLFLALLALLAVFILWPLLRVLAVAVSGPDGFTLAHFRSFFARALFLEATLNTLLAGVAAVALGSLVALPLAVLLARYDFTGRGLVQTLAVLPLVIPPFVGAIAFQQILGRSGLVNLLLLDTLGTSIPFMEGLGGVVLVQTLHYFPFILVNTATALQSIDPTSEEAAQTLGCHGWRLLRRVTLPLALPGYVAGALLAFIRVIDDLGTPLMLNYTKLLAPQAYLRVTTVGMNDVDGYVICVILVGLSVGALWAAKAFLGRAEWASLARGPERVPRALAGRRAVVAWLVAGPLLALALLPHAGIVVLSFSRVWSFSYLPTRWTLDNYGEILVRTPHFVWNTLRYALLAAGIDVVLGALIAWLLLRGRVPGRGALDVIATLPLAVPGVVLAIGYLRVFHGWDLPGVGKPLTALWMVLVVVYAVRRLPYTVRAAYATLQQLHVSMEESAQSLGAPPARTFRRITLPLMTRGLVAGGLIAFITSAVELSSTILLVPRIELGPLSYGIYVYMQSAVGRGPGAALGVVAIVLVAAGTWLINRIGARGTGAAFRL
ncbi:MAG TPA: iron ABC transporter permease [Methylomirabilota bacterium]|nr:iron ABC transporter permease [Methylomirabilota bacterium]HEV8615158.1 iron ABC transporter permease [Methylomirabilota bacterium]